MKINHDTDRLIVMNYPRGGGGKYLAACLAINPFICHMNEKSSKLKMKHKWGTAKSFALSMKPLEMSKLTGRHFEYGNRQMSGFKAGQVRRKPEADDKKANSTYRYLTNQNEYYFCMTESDQTNTYGRYKNARNIVLKNYEWIQKSRNISSDNNKWVVDFDDREYPNSIDFDMHTLRDSDEGFVAEFEKVYKFLGLEMVEAEYLTRMRQAYLETVNLGFKEGDHDTLNAHALVDRKHRTSEVIDILREEGIVTTGKEMNAKKQKEETNKE